VLSGRLQTLGTDIADPLERLAAITAIAAIAAIAEATVASRSGSDRSTTNQVL
jgi:diacylglycerol O-acyltransferase